MIGRAWADLSLRNTLLLFALGLVTVPGLLFALLAFPGARQALEREVGIQLHQTAELGADALASSFARAQGDARSWAGQDVMRDLLVGDVDKRVSKFLQAVRNQRPAYLEALCVDAEGVVVAASSGSWIGRNLRGSALGALLDKGEEAIEGPTLVPELGREAVLIAAPIDDPDAPGRRIGSVLLVYDWGDVGALLEAIRAKLTAFGKDLAAIVVDASGAVIGGVSFDAETARGSPLASQSWSQPVADGWGERRAPAGRGDRAVVIFGRAAVSNPPTGWSVIFIESESAALAAVRGIRSRWITIMAALLVTGLTVATLLARRVMQPLSDVTAATGRMASRPDLALPLLPVHSRNEVGQLTDSFNKMTTALRQSREEALTAAKFAFAGELAAMVAHEVRTPLSVMRSCAQMLTMPAPPAGADNTELIDTIVAEVDRVERVVSGLLQLVRPVEQRRAPTSIRDVLSRAAGFAASDARRRQVRLTCELADGEPRALCDAEQIYQVVLNLVVNALQALPPGGQLWLRTLPADGTTVGFEVGDDGPGLPPAIRDRIFEPFVTGREGGTGLGLAFVERVVKASRGSIAVRSEAGQGTVFEVRLPMAEVP